MIVDFMAAVSHGTSPTGNMKRFNDRIVTDDGAYDHGTYDDGT